jgi:glycosyltransferase involved in cell wall biosynthesis
MEIEIWLKCELNNCDFANNTVSTQTELPNQFPIEWIPSCSRAMSADEKKLFRKIPIMFGVTTLSSDVYQKKKIVLIENEFKKIYGANINFKHFFYYYFKLQINYLHVNSHSASVQFFFRCAMKNLVFIFSYFHWSSNWMLSWEMLSPLDFQISQVNRFSVKRKNGRKKETFKKTGDIKKILWKKPRRLKIVETSSCTVMQCVTTLMNKSHLQPNGNNVVQFFLFVSLEIKKSVVVSSI